MLRKTFLVVATVATLSVAALTPAAAHGHGGHWGRGWGFGGFGGGIVVIDSSCYQWVRGLGRVYVCG